jgi:UDP-glucuronate decarboxylase
MTIRWITPFLGTAAASAVFDKTDACIVDVRDLVDKAGNGTDAIRDKIFQGVEYLAQGRRVIVCCDYGISRSNAIATGILATVENIAFDAALRQVQEATGESEIRLSPLSAVRKALGLPSPTTKGSRNPSVLVTGGGGFLGKALRARLAGEFRVSAPTRGRIDIALGSTQLDLLASEEDVECIVHLANPRACTSNVAMGHSLTLLRNAIDVCLERDLLLIYPSSWEVYSGYAGTLHADESTPALPRGPNGETKYLAEMLIEHCRRTAGLRCALLRSSLVYGTGCDRPRFLYNFIEKAKRAQTIVTHCYKNGLPCLDLLHVDDFVSALIATLRSNFVGNLNIGTGVLTSTQVIAEMLRDLMGSTSCIDHTLIEADMASVSMNSSRALVKLNWWPSVSLKSGFERIVSELCINRSDHEH